MNHPNRLSSEFARKRFIDVTPFLRHALTYPPEKVIELAAEKRAADEPSRSLGTAALIADSIMNSFLQKNERPKHGLPFLRTNLKDVEKILVIVATKYPDMSDEMILQAMSHPETIDAFALLSLRKDHRMLNYIFEHLQDTISLSSNEDAFVINDTALEIESEGCPAAGYTSRHSGDHITEGTVAPLRIFGEFIEWTTRVNLLSDEWKRFRETLMLEK